VIRGSLVLVGARGFLGGAVAEAAMTRGIKVTPARAGDEAASGDADIVVYVSGLAFGANTNPAEAYRRHVVDAARWASAPHASFTYVSSTRVYEGSDGTGEATPLTVTPGLGDVYVHSKLAGEIAVLDTTARGRVARVSNLAGGSVHSGLFLSDVLRQAATDGVVRLRSALDSAKDYLDVRDAANWLLDVAAKGTERIYNLARGRNTSHGELLDALAQIAGVRVEIPAGAPTVIVPPIDATRITSEFPRVVRDPVAELPGYFAAFTAAR
jgi:nucleoside-diphosphate-sugar epimerase